MTTWMHRRAPALQRPVAARLARAPGVDYNELMAVSARDRDYMRRLGELQAEGARERAAEHRALSVDGRLRRGLELFYRFVDHANLAARHDDPAPLDQRARQLGLYRP